MMSRRRENSGMLKRTIPLLIFACITISVFAQDYSGTYLCDFSGTSTTIYIQIIQEDTEVQVQFNLFCPYYYGTVEGEIMNVALWDTGTMDVTFSEDNNSFAGTYWFPDESGTVTGVKVPDDQWPGVDCWDYETLGIPQFVESDYTQLEKISSIDRFRSGYGHDYSDDFESCRSMKHGYMPFSEFIDNNLIEIYSPVDGVIENIQDDQHGSSEGLTNKQVHIKSDEYPAFIFVIFHTDLLSSDFIEGYHVTAGQLIGHARMYYPDLNEYSTGFEIAIHLNTFQGERYVSFFETMTQDLFDNYIERGATSRFDFIIPKQARDSDPLICDGETFLTSGNIPNEFQLTFNNGFDYCGPDFGSKDQQVDIWDLRFIMNQGLREDCMFPDFCQRCDTNRDGKVDLHDLSIFCRHWLWIQEQ